MTLDGLIISDSVTFGPGGGIAVDAAGGVVELMLDRVTLAGNRSFGFRGGLDMQAEDGATITAHITRSEFAGNRALAGGALSARGFGTGRDEVTVEDSRFSRNAAFAQGGAVTLTDFDDGGLTSLTARRSIFDKNKAGQSSSGGAISIDVDAGDGQALQSSLTLENGRPPPRPSSPTSSTTPSRRTRRAPPPWTSRRPTPAAPAARPSPPACGTTSCTRMDVPASPRSCGMPSRSWSWR